MRDRHLLDALPRPLHSRVARVTEQADSEAHAAGLTVEVLPGGVRRYRDPRLDQLATRRTGEGAVNPVADPDWSQPRLVVVAGWSR
jgi:hypothetical protein